MKTALALSIAGLLVLSACGSSTSDRTLSGAGIGAGVGTAVGAVTGLSLLEGALIGAAAGGLTGALTDEDVINFGDPIWADDDQDANRAAVSRVQAGLQRLGYNPGAVDGIQGSQTTQAIRNYQRDHGLLVDGRASYELAAHIEEQLRYQS